MSTNAAAVAGRSWYTFINLAGKPDTFDASLLGLDNMIFAKYPPHKDKLVYRLVGEQAGRWVLGTHFNDFGDVDDTLRKELVQTDIEVTPEFVLRFFRDNEWRIPPDLENIKLEADPFKDEWVQQFYRGEPCTATESTAPVAEATQAKSSPGKTAVTFDDAYKRVRDFLKDSPKLSQRQIAAITGVSFGQVNKILKRLHDQGIESHQGPAAKERPLTEAILATTADRSREPSDIAAEYDAKEAKYLDSLDENGRAEFRGLTREQKRVRVTDHIIGEPDPYPESADDTARARLTIGISRKRSQRS